MSSENKDLFCLDLNVLMTFDITYIATTILLL